MTDAEDLVEIVGDLHGQYLLLQSHLDDILGLYRKLKRSPGGTQRSRVAAKLDEVNLAHKILKAGVAKSGDSRLAERLQGVDRVVELLYAERSVDKKITALTAFRREAPALEILVAQFVSRKVPVLVPDWLPMTEVRLDFEEALQNLARGAHISTIVMCRRAYEGALVAAYKSRVARDPISPITCPHCGKRIRDGYMGIGKLHAWAISEHLVTERMKQVGFLVADIGAGGAHPPLQAFPRDEHLAQLAVVATAALLRQLYEKGA